MTGRQVEIYVDAAWVDVTSYVRYEAAINIGRGRGGEGRDVDRSTATFQLNNRDGRFSPRNPTSPYYGLIGRNTPCRVSALGGTRSMAMLTGAARATTTDKATLDITGDIDIRADLTMPNWHEDLDVASKWTATGNERSWFLGMGQDGKIYFFWSTTGADTLTTNSTMPVPRSTGRQSIRVTIDVNNGAAGRTITFYTSDSISGTWVQLGDAVVQAGTTSIFSSSAIVAIGDSTDFGQPGFSGQLHAFEIRNGIAGTVVANPDFSIPAEGATSFADTAGTPNTWTLTGGTVTNRRYRFHGEISSWPVSWDITGRDVWVSVEASGIIRRLTQGAAPLDSALRRTIVRDLQPVAYWPCEDTAGSASVATPLTGQAPMRIVGEVDFGVAGPAGSTGAIEPQGTAQLTAPVNAMSATSPAGWTIAFWMTLPADFNVAVDNSNLIEWRVPGASVRTLWFIHVTVGTTGRLIFGAFNADMSTLVQSASPTASLVGTTSFVLLRGRASGANTVVDLYVNGVLDDSLTTADVTNVVTSVGVNTLTVTPSGSISHLTVDHQADYLDYLDQMYQAGLGFAGETAGRRIERLTGEEGVAFQAYGDLDETEAMGPQEPLTLLALVREAAACDMGMLAEPRDQLGLGYRPRVALYNQDPTLALTYSAYELAAPLDPVDDDQGVRNDITVSRDGGSYARAVLETGALSIQAPPDGVGRYDEGLTVSLEGDDQLADQAGWRLHLGTVDEARYPKIALNLVHPAITGTAALLTQAMALDVGDRLTVDGLPSFLPPDDLSQVVQGFAERLGGMTHDLAVTCSPESPYQVGVTDDDVLGRADTEGCELAEDLTTTETAVDVATTSGPRWTLAAGDVPFDVSVGGEVMTVTEVHSGIYDDFGRSVSNGWGTADSGAVWAPGAGMTASDYATNGSKGTMSLGSVNVERRILVPLTAPDHTLRVAGVVPVAPTGAPINWGLLLRYVDADNYYWVDVSVDTTGTMTLRLVKRVATVLSQVATALTHLTHVAGTEYTLLADVAGSAVRAKLYVGTEPENWALQTTDTAIAAGASVGCVSRLQTGNTNGLPVVATFDGFRVLNPQTLDVSRSANGVVKAHSAGADVRLTHPMITSL